MNFTFEWNDNKAQTNLKKHKISFEEAETVFIDPYLTTYPDEKHSSTEERFISIGYSTKDRVLMVVHTEREDKTDYIVIRIISCRKATARERSIYETGIY